MAGYRSEDDGYATLREALDSRKAYELKKLAQLFSMKGARRKGECIDAIEKALAGEGLRRLWNDLDDLSRAAVAEVAHAEGNRLDTAAFVAKYGKKPRRYYSDYRDKTKNVPWTLLDVVFTGNSMPRDLKERFRAFVPEPPAPSVKTVDELPSAVQLPVPSWRARAGEQPVEHPLSVCETEAAALHDFTAVLRLIDAGKMSVSAKTRRPTLSSVRTVADVLRDGDFAGGEKAEEFMRAFAWPLLVQAAGLTRFSGGKLKLSKTGRDALASPVHEMILLIWRRWLDKGLIDEFKRIEGIKGQNRKGRGGLTSVAERRSDVEEVLYRCPAGQWIEIDEFFRYFQATGVSLEVVQDPWRLYITDSHYGSLGYDGYHKWSMIQGRYIMALLWEYAATLGLVDIAHIPAESARDDFWENWGTDDLPALSRYDGLKYFRITALGAWCLDMAEEYVSAPKAVRPLIKVLPNHDVVISNPACFPAADTLFLDRIAEKKKRSPLDY